MREQHEMSDLQRLVRLLAEREETLASAESVTGGMLSTWLTDLAGSSQVYRGGVCAYVEDCKARVLGVDPDLIARCGVVSETVAKAMAEGVRRLVGSTYAVSTTGYAGPQGGTERSPLGTVWCAVASPRATEAVVWRFTGDRSSIRRQAARQALAHLLQAVERGLS